MRSDGGCALAFSSGWLNRRIQVRPLRAQRGVVVHRVNATQLLQRILGHAGQSNRRDERARLCERAR